jgi:hypothetical protein
VQIFKNKWFARFASKEGIEDQKLRDAVKAAERGIIDADLGGGVIKQRVAREGAGKSGGYRTIILYRKGDSAFLVYGFPKSERDNITPAELREFKKLAEIMLNMTSKQIEDQITTGHLQKVTCDEDEKD